MLFAFLPVGGKTNLAFGDKRKKVKEKIPNIVFDNQLIYAVN